MKANTSRVPWLAIVILSLTVLFIFYPALSYYFSRDDFGFFPKINYAWWQIKEVMAPYANWFYRPLSQQMYFFINYKLSGLNPFSYHAGNLIFHFFNGLLTYLILRKLKLNTLASITGSIFYVSSRIHLMSVYWISTYTEISGTFYYFLTFYLFLLYLETRKVRWQILSFVSLTLGFLSRESLVTLPVWIGFYLVMTRLPWNLRKITRSQIFGLIELTLPYALLTLIYLILYSTYVTLPEGPYARVYTLLPTLKTILKYISSAFVTSADKTNLVSLLNGLIVLRIAVFAAGLGVVTWLSVRRRQFEILRPYILGTGWFMIGILPYIFVPEHAYPYYLSISFLGLSLILGQFVVDLNQYFKVHRNYLLLLAIGLIALNIGIGKINHAASSYLEWVKLMQYGARISSESLKTMTFEPNQTVYITPSHLMSQSILFFGALIRVHYLDQNLQVKFLENSDLENLPTSFKVLQFNDDYTLTNITGQYRKLE